MASIKKIDLRRAQLAAADITSKVSAASAIKPIMLSMGERHAACLRSRAALEELKSELLAAIKTTVGHGTAQSKYDDYVRAFSKINSLRALEAYMPNIYLYAEGLGMTA